jgi:hypothetical protein
VGWSSDKSGAAAGDPKVDPLRADLEKLAGKFRRLGKAGRSNGIEMAWKEVRIWNQAVRYVHEMQSGVSTILAEVWLPADSPPRAERTFKEYSLPALERIAASHLPGGKGPVKIVIVIRDLSTDRMITSTSECDL